MCWPHVVATNRAFSGPAARCSAYRLNPAFRCVSSRPAGRRRRARGGGTVSVLPLAREQWGTRASVIVVELAPHVLDEPPQRAVGTVDQRHHPLARARAAGTLAVADVELAEAAQAPQRPAESGADLLQVPNVPADGAVRQARRGPCEDEP